MFISPLSIIICNVCVVVLLISYLALANNKRLPHYRMALKDTQEDLIATQKPFERDAISQVS